MVYSILFPASRPTIKELEDPIDRAEGFREGLRMMNDSEFTKEHLRNKLPELEENLEKLEALRSALADELDHATTVTTVGGKKVDLQRYTAIIGLVGTLVTGVLSGGIAFGGNFVADKYNAMVAGASGTVAAIGAQFVNKVKDFQNKAESREALLKMLNSRIDPYERHLKGIKEKAEEDNPLAVLEAARKGAGGIDLMAKFLNEKPRENRNETNGLRRRAVTTGDVEANQPLSSQ